MRSILTWDRSCLYRTGKEKPVKWRKLSMVRAVVGANWGDEGKGKITDMLGQESDIIVIFQ